MLMNPATNGRPLTPIPEVLIESDSQSDFERFIEQADISLQKEIVDPKHSLMREVRRSISLTDIANGNVVWRFKRAGLRGKEYESLSW